MQIKSIFKLAVLLISSTLLVACNDNDFPPLENEEEVIDLVRFTFTPTQGNALVFEAKDLDGEGAANFEIPKIVLLNNTTYGLTIEIENSQTGDDITTEVKEEGDEHLFFFGWTIDLFTSPQGNGNMDNRADEVVYLDKDNMDLPIGLTTSWTTGMPALGAQFRMVLKHQPDIKSSTSAINEGETDIDLTWKIEII